MSVRSARPSYTMEDYLVVLYELRRSKGYVVMGEVANRLDVSPPSVTNMLKRLQREGYIKYERYKGVTVTEMGERVAKQLLRKRHILLEFMNMLGIDKTEAHQEAQRIANCVNISTLERLEKFLRTISADPRILKSK